MAVKIKRVTIDNDEYEITQLGAIQGRRVWLKVLHVLAEPVKVLGEHEKFNEHTFANMVAAAVTGLDEATTEDLYAVFGDRCTIRVMGDQGERWPNLKGEVFDQHFAGRYVTMSKWLVECVLFNFADFLGDTTLGSLAAKLQAMAKKAGSRVPSTSTGTSGESSRISDRQ